MKRYSKEALDNMSPSAFSIDVLTHELKQKDPSAPVAGKIRQSISQLYLDERSHISYALLAQIFRAWEQTTPAKHLAGYIVFTEDSFEEKNLPLGLRTYWVSSGNKGYRPNKASRSIYGRPLDGSSRTEPLHHLMAAECGGRDGWRAEYCILIGEE